MTSRQSGALNQLTGRLVRMPACALLGLAQLLLASCSDHQASRPQEALSGPVIPSAPMAFGTPMITPGLTRPPMKSVDETGIADDVPVIGISLGDEHRAYVIDAMKGIATHVINDVLAEQAVTVTYCDRTDCIRVLTDPKSKAPLSIQIGGWMQDEMALYIDNKMILQSAEDMPFETLEYERTTWGEWKENHPDTVVYSGEAG